VTGHQDSFTGTVLQDRFAIGDWIASGTFAAVYRAFDWKTSEPCAVKILDAAALPEAVARFRTEAETLSRLRHPNIVTVRAYGEHAGRAYMVLDYVEGGTILSRLESQGFMNPDDVCLYAIQTLAALAAAHAAGVVHRDVKPGNVLLDRQGNGRLCDFGIARIQTANTNMTQMGVSLGTLLYMAPEQRTDAHSVDLTVDLYGVGTLIYRLITNSNPSDLCFAGLESPRWQLLPAAVRPIVFRATRAQPADRYPDARSMAQDLLKIVPPDRRADVAGRPGTDPSRFPDPAPELRVNPPAEGVLVEDAPPRPLRWRVGAAVAVVLLLGLLGWWVVS
jgi:serine/threonine-protein kinase